MSPGNKGNLNAGLNKHLYAMAIPHIEYLKFISPVVQDDASVGEDSIHIEDEKFDIFRDLLQFLLCPFQLRDPLFQNIMEMDNTLCPSFAVRYHKGGYRVVFHYR